MVDLAAGTGKLTRLLAMRFDRVVAVEPDAALRALIRSAETLAGSAEQIPLPEIARVLRPVARSSSTLQCSGAKKVVGLTAKRLRHNFLRGARLPSACGLSPRWKAV